MSSKAKKAESVEATEKLVSKFLPEGCLLALLYRRVQHILITGFAIDIHPPKRRRGLTWRSTPVPGCIKIGILLVCIRYYGNI
jgi:hypothetical protein